MADQRLTDRSELSSLAAGDKIHIVDVSDSTDNAAGSSKWFLISTISSYLAALTQTLTNKTLTSPKINEDVAVTATATELNYVDGVTSAVQTQLDAKVADTGDETIAGVKTFSSSPIVPTPTTNFQAATKAYADGLVYTDGWTPANETWTYASASTITVPSGAASRYKKGDPIKWTQTTVKYGVIVAVADTLITIAVNTDYVVANAAITDNYYSHQANPIGYPGTFAWTTTWTGFSVNPGGAWKYSIIGNKCTMYWADAAAGTSNGGTLQFTLPVAPLRTSNSVICNVTDNGTNSSTPGHMLLTASNVLVSVYKTFFQGTWTTSNGKNFIINSFSFEF